MRERQRDPRGDGKEGEVSGRDEGGGLGEVDVKGRQTVGSRRKKGEQGSQQRSSHLPK